MHQVLARENAWLILHEYVLIMLQEGNDYEGKRWQFLSSVHQGRLWMSDTAWSEYATDFCACEWDEEVVCNLGANFYGPAI